MGRHRLRLTPLGWSIRTLTRIIMSLATFHASLLMWEATIKRRKEQR